MGQPEKRKQVSSTLSNDDARDDIPLAKLPRQARVETRTKKKHDASSSQARPQVPRETEAKEVEGGDEPVQPQAQESEESNGNEVWRRFFRNRRAFQLYTSKFLDRAFNPERVINLKSVEKKNPDIYRRVQKHTNWEQVLSKPLCQANENMVLEFYANLATNKEGDTRVFCRGKYVEVSASSLNKFLQLEDFKTPGFKKIREMTEKQQRAWLVPIIGRETNPKWKNSGVQIHRGDLNFEAKGWHYILISRVRPTSQDHKLTVHQAVMIGCLMRGIKINLGVEMAEEIIETAHSDKKRFAFPQTLMAYLMHHGVERLPEDFFSKPKKPFDWYAIKEDSTAPSASGALVPSVSTLPSSSRADIPHDSDTTTADDTAMSTEPEVLPRAVSDLYGKLEEIKTLVSNLLQVQPPPPPPPPKQSTDMIQAMRAHTLAIEGNMAALQANTKALEKNKQSVDRLSAVVTGLSQHFNVPMGLITPSTANAPTPAPTPAPPAVQPSKASDLVTYKCRGKDID